MPKIDLKNISLSLLPTSEDDVYEFKSSQTSINELGKKLCRAASGFANSGGGCFLYGLDDDGNVDGGVSPKVGRQDLRDWIDQIVSSVSPVPEYEVRIFDNSEGRGTLGPGKVVAAASIYPSELGPHQASDHKYYIRAGAHTVSANHVIVEALWARRYMRKPILVHALRAKPGASQVVQIGVVSATDTPALNVEITLSPLNGALRRMEKYLPIKLPVVDQSNPFYLDGGIMHMADDELADDVKLTVKYEDYAGNVYHYKNEHPLLQSLSPHTIGSNATEKMAKALGNLEKPLKALANKK